MIQREFGFFGTFEGGEGSGKTSVVAEVAERLRMKGISVVTVREPGGTPIGDQIRDILDSFENKEITPRTEVLLFQSSRSQLVDQVIKPALNRGEVVLSDRYADSTKIYQGAYGVFSRSEMQPIIEFATQGLKPDLTLLLDVDVEVGLGRRARQGGVNRLDAYDHNFHEKVRRGYLQLADEDSGRWIVVDANRKLNEVCAEAQSIVENRLIRGGFIEKPRTGRERSF